MNAERAIRVSLTPGAWLGRIMASVCRCAAGDLDRLPSAPEVSIHALRVRMKKLRALLRLTEPQLSGAVRARLRKRMREIKNAFATSRESDVLQKLANRLKREHRLPRAAFLSGSPAALPLPLPAVKRKLAALRRSLAALPLTGLTKDDLLTAYAARYRACRRAMKECSETAPAECFHHWRKRVKDWYFLSLALHRCRTARDHIRSAEKLGHWLGEEHDLSLLASRVTGPGAGKWRAVIKQQLRQRRARILTKGAKALAGHRRRLLRRLEKEALS
jgi:CHAD domain-containing protein